MKDKLHKLEIHAMYCKQLLDADIKTEQQRETIYKYISKCVNDLETQGWSTWSGLIREDLEVDIPQETTAGMFRIWKVEKGTAALQTFIHAANEWRKATAFRVMGERAYGDALLAVDQYKTELALGKIRFNDVWNKSRKYPVGSQGEIF